MAANLERLEETGEALYDKALFCLKTGIAPSEYDGFTDQELQAFIDAYNDLVKENNKRD